MKIKLLYCRLLFLFGGIIFSLNSASQNETAPDTIIIKPQGDYSIATDTVVAEPEEIYTDQPVESDQEAAGEIFNDTLQPEYRLIPADTIREIENDKKFYYKNYFDSLLRASQKINNKPAKTKPPADSFFKSVFNFIIWVAAIGLLAYLIYSLFLSNSAMFSRNRKNYAGEIIRTEEENPENPGSLVEQAAAIGNYRLAVRYLYLQTLMNLAEKNYIKTGTEKTNYQYVNEIRHHSFANEFSALTLQYEYVWYGGYDLDNEVFEQVHSGFKNFNKNISR